MSDADGQDPGPLDPAAQQDPTPEFMSWVVNRLFSIGLILESARSIAGDGPAGGRVAAATDEVDQLIRDIRTTWFRLATEPDAAHAKEPAASLQDRMADIARAMQARALDAAALLEQQADIARQPSQTDHPAEIKRWQSFARQAEQIAERWEQRS